MGISCSSSSPPPVVVAVATAATATAPLKVLDIYFSQDCEPFVCKHGPEFELHRPGGISLSVFVPGTRAEVIRKLHSSSAVPLSDLYIATNSNFILYLQGEQLEYISPRENFKGVLSSNPSMLRIFQQNSSGKWKTFFITDVEEDWNKYVFDGVIILPKEKIGTKTWEADDIIIKV